VRFDVRSIFLTNGLFSPARGVTAVWRAIQGDEGAFDRDAQHDSESKFRTAYSETRVAAPHLPPFPLF
jgi:hypothetical protein